MKNIKKEYIFYIISILLITSCTSIKKDDNKELAREPEKWSFNGGISVSYKDSDCKDSICQRKIEQGRISWAKNNSSYNITLSDPFRRPIWTIKGKDNKAELKEKEVYYIEDVNAFISKQLNIPLSLEIFYSWLFGKPYQYNDYKVLDKNTFIQNKLKVELSFNENGKVRQIRVTDTSTENQLKLVIKEWFF